MDWTTLYKPNSALRRIMDQPGLTIQAYYDGLPFKGVRQMMKRQDANSDVGFVEGDYQFSLLCLADQFTNGMPTPRRSKVEVAGTAFRVLSLDQDATAGFVTIHLGSVQQ